MSPFLGVSQMAYCIKTRDMKTTMRERARDKELTSAVKTTFCPFYALLKFFA
jgi:hypothetical protein